MFSSRARAPSLRVVFAALTFLGAASCCFSFLAPTIASEAEGPSPAKIGEGELLCAIAAAVDSSVLTTFSLEQLATTMEDLGLPADAPKDTILARARSAWLTRSLLLGYADAMGIKPTEEEAIALAREYADDFRKGFENEETFARELRERGLTEDQLVQFFRTEYSQQIDERLRVERARLLVLEGITDPSEEREREAIQKLGNQLVLFNYFRSVSPSAYEWDGKVEVSEIRVSGDHRVDRRQIAEHVSSKVGEPLSLEQLSRDIEALYRVGAFADIAVYGSRAERLVLTFRVLEVDPAGLLRFAAEAKKSGNPRSATGPYRRLLAAFPDAPEAREATDGAVAAYLEMGDSLSAAELRWTRAAYYAQHNAPDLAEAEYRKVPLESPGTPRGAYYLSVFLIGQEKYEEAVKWAEVASSAAPGDALVRLHLMQSRALAGQAKEALEEAERISQMFPDQAGQIYYAVAGALKQTGRIEEAMHAAFQATRHTGPPEANLLLGEILLVRGMKDQAAEEFEKAFKAKADDVTLQMESAYGVLRSGKAAKAAELCVAIITRRPDAPGHAYAIHAIALQELKKENEALAAAAEAIKRTPASQIAYPEFRALAEKVQAR